MPVTPTLGTLSAATGKIVEIFYDKPPQVDCPTAGFSHREWRISERHTGSATIVQAAAQACLDFALWCRARAATFNFTLSAFGAIIVNYGADFTSARPSVGRDLI